MARALVSDSTERFLDAFMAVRQMIQAANFNRFQKAGISATQFMVLNLLPVRAPGVSLGELARRMNLAASTVAKTVDSLAARGLVERVASADDARITLVEVTAAGRRLQNAASAQFHTQMKRLFSAMSAAERKGLVEGLEALATAGRGRGAAPAARSSERPARG